MSKVIHLRLNDSHDKMLKKLADRWGYSYTNLLRKLLVDTYELKCLEGELV